jgi:hypothetical protein
MSLLATVFDDKRLMCVCLGVWLCMLLGIFSHLGITETQMLSFGPSPHTRFVGVAIDTWYKWGLVAAFSFTNTLINDLSGDSIVPFLTNVVQDHKTLYLPYSKAVCWGISSAWGFYVRMVSVLSIFLLMSQVDFVLIGALADLIVNTYTCFRFMRGKVYDPERFWSWLHTQEAGEAAAARAAADAPPPGVPELEMSELGAREADTAGLLRPAP